MAAAGLAATAAGRPRTAIEPRAVPAAIAAARSHRRTACPTRRAPPAGAASGSSESDASALAWARATVIENRAESGDGAFRTLRLSVADDVPTLSGSVRASVRGKAAGRRWIDGYKAPGQQVGVRLVGGPSSSPPEGQGTGAGGGGAAAAAAAPPPARRLVLATSPYEALRESASLAASIIELMVDREEEPDDGAFYSSLGCLAPGAELEVSSVQGAGWAPMFASDDGGAPALEAALEDGRPLLVIGAGAAGAAALRSTLEWTPVQAAASAGRVAAVLAAGRGGPGGAPYLRWFDLWRGFGVDLHTVSDLPPACGNLALEAALFAATFGGDGGGGGGGGGGDTPVVGALPALAAAKAGTAGVTALVGGCPRPVALAIMRRLEAEGVPSAHILFGDPYF